MLNQLSAFPAVRPAAFLMASGALALAAATFAGAAAVPEPDTVLYGRIINRSAGTGGLVTAGTLSWTIEASAQESRTFTTDLESLQSGTYSYRLRIPHTLAATGLLNPAGTVPLTAQETAWNFGTISVDGIPAVVSANQVRSIEAGQELRGQAVRIDLEILQAMPDSDGDGMPDWWELAHGLNPNLAADADADTDGDGLSNLAEWKAGLSPSENNRVPSLMRHELAVYPTGTSGLALRVADTDTDAAALAVVVTAVPADGNIVVRNGTGGRVLKRGDVFSAADANQGLVEYRRDSSTPPASPHTVLGIAMVDSTGGSSSPLRPGWTFDPDQFTEGSPLNPVLQEVRLAFVSETAPSNSPSSALAADIAADLPDVTGNAELRAKAAYFAQAGTGVIWDLLDHPTAETVKAVSGSFSAEEYQTQRQPQFGPDRPVFVLGGSGNDTFEGGYGPDVLYGGTGEDSVKGNRGADLFIAASSSLLTVADFNPADGDRLDLCLLFEGLSGYADDYVRISPLAEGGSVLETFRSSSLSGTPNATVRLPSFPLSIESFADLASRGAILTGSLSTRPVLNIQAAGNAAENDLKPGRLTFRRTGPSTDALVLHLTFSGTATAGEDYDVPSHTLTMAAGESEATLLIYPRADQTSEGDEVIKVTISADPAYRVGSQSSAEIQILDLLPMFALESVRAEAWCEPWMPATIRIQRTGLTDRASVLSLDWTGSRATRLVEPLPFAIEFAKGETSRLVEVRPLRTATLPAEPEVLTLKLRNDASYVTGDPAWARIVIVPRPIDFDDWAAGAFPGTTDFRALAFSDPDTTGLSVLERFAFSLTAALPDYSSPALPRVVLRDGRYGVEFTVRPGSPGMTFRVQASSNLQQWTSDPSVITPALPEGDPFPAGWHRYEWRNQDSSGPRYFRVDFDYQP